MEILSILMGIYDECIDSFYLESIHVTVPCFLHTRCKLFCNFSNDECILYEVDSLDKISENYLSASSSRRFLSSLRSLLFYKE